MIKRICTALIALSIILTVVPCYTQAASTDISREKVILTALNIIDEKTTSKISYDDYIKSLMNIVSYENTSSQENFARSMGLINVETKYNGKDTITVGEAAKYAVILAGYGIEVKDKKTESYVKTGYNIGLFDKVSFTSSDTLSSEVMVGILYNLLEVNPIIWIAKDTYEAQTEKDMLGMYREIYHHEGLVTANEYTSINDTEGASENQIEINNEVFDVSAEYDDELLGKYVEVYIQESKDYDPVVIYVGELDRRNEILEIETVDIESIADDFSTVKYYVNNKLKRAKLDKYLKVIYNGEFYDEYTIDDLKPNVGKISLINLDTDSEYDIVNVMSYQTMVVDSVNVSDKVIINKYGFEGCIDRINLDDRIYSIIKDGKEFSISDISIGDVLSVAKTLNPSDERYKIYVSSLTEESKVELIDSEMKEITTEEDTYRYTEEFEKQLSYKGQRLELGKNYVFYFDAFGNIVYAEKKEENDYCLLYKIKVDEYLDDAVTIQYLTLDNEWKVHKLRKKVQLSTDGRNSETVEAIAVYNILSGLNPQIVKIKKNTKDEITSLYLPRETMQFSENVFRKTPKGSYWYRSGATFENKFYITKDTKMFVFPESGRGNIEDYYVTSAYGAFAADNQYAFSAYDVDNFSYTNLIAVTASQVERMSSSVFLVTKMTQMLTEYNEIATQLVCSGAGLKDVTFTVLDQAKLNRISSGDVVRISIDADGYVSNINKLTSLGGEFEVSGTSNFHQTTTFINATVVDIDYSGWRIKLDCGSEEVAFPFSNTTPCVEYNKSLNQCELISPAELIKEDNVFVRISWSGIAEIIRVVEG